MGTFKKLKSLYETLKILRNERLEYLKIFHNVKETREEKLREAFIGRQNILPYSTNEFYND